MSGDSTADEDDKPGPGEHLGERLEGRFGDPEERFGDPETDGLIPGVGETDAQPESVAADELAADLSAVDEDLLDTFTICVVLADIGLLLVTIGALLVVVQGWLWIGLGLVGGGFLALARLVHHYRSYIDDRAADGDDQESADGAADGATDETADGTADGTALQETNETGHNR